MPFLFFPIQHCLGNLNPSLFCLAFFCTCLEYNHPSLPLSFSLSRVHPFTFQILSPFRKLSVIFPCRVIPPIFHFPSTAPLSTALSFMAIIYIFLSYKRMWSLCAQEWYLSLSLFFFPLKLSTESGTYRCSAHIYKTVNNK